MKIEAPRKNLIEALSQPQSKDGMFNLSYAEFVKFIQDCIPEAHYLDGEAHASAEGIAANKTTRNFHGLTQDEAIRAFCGLVCFKDVMVGTQSAYANFIACQIEMKKPVLSFESFQAIRAYVLKTLTSPEMMAAAMWSILCNDLGKVKVIEEEYTQVLHKENVGHDLLLGDLLMIKPDLFPGFMNLPENLRQSIAAGYSSGCDISQFEQCELPIVSLEGLKSLDETALHLYILHTIFDVAGAAALFRSNGSLTMHQETWDFFNSTRECLEGLHQKSMSIEEAYAKYLTYRGFRVGIENNSPENFALIRIAGLARLASLEQGLWLKRVWEELSPAIKATLINELTTHGGQGKQAIFIGYGVAMIINSQGALIKALKENIKPRLPDPNELILAHQEGLRIGLINLACALNEARKDLTDTTCKEVFVAECESVAKFLGLDPRGSLDRSLERTSFSLRRMDLKMGCERTLQEGDLKRIKSDGVGGVSSFGVFAPPAIGTSSAAASAPRL